MHKLSFIMIRSNNNFIYKKKYFIINLNPTHMQLVTRTVRVLFTCSRQVTEHTRVLYLGNKFLYLVSPFGAVRTLTSSIIIIIFIVVVLNFRRFELTPNSSLGPKRTRPVEPEVVLCSLSPFSFCVCIIHHTCMEFDRFFAVVL